MKSALHCFYTLLDVYIFVREALLKKLQGVSELARVVWGTYLDGTVLLCVKNVVHETVSYACMHVGKFHSTATGEGLSQCHVAFFSSCENTCIDACKKAGWPR